MLLANQMVQVTSDAKTRPTITPFTTMSAAMNIPQGDRSRGNLSATSGEVAEGCSTAGAGLDGAGVACEAVAAGGSAAGGEPGGVVWARSLAGRTRLTATAAVTRTARYL